MCSRAAARLDRAEEELEREEINPADQRLYGKAATHDATLAQHRDPQWRYVLCSRTDIRTAGATAAVTNAVFHATGRRNGDLPITLDKLM
jgi:hypothetical protein